MFTKKSIESSVDNIVYQGGLKLYQSGAVKDLHIDYDEQTGLNYITALVSSSHRRHDFEVNIILSKDMNWIIDTQCTCPYYREYMEPCKHITAVLLAAYDELTNEQSNTKKVHHTDPLMQKLMNTYKPSLPEKTTGLTPLSAPVELEPHLSLNESEKHILDVDFRIGVPGGHMYVIQNLTDFTTAIRNHEAKKYGKQLNFVHDLSAFSKKSRKMAEFLLSLTDDDDQYTESSGYAYYGYYNSYYQNNTLRKNLSLKGRYLDLFIDLITDTNAWMDVSGSYLISVTDGNPQIQGSIVKDADGGYTLKGLTAIYFTGRDHLYFYDADRMSLIRTARDEHRIPLLKYLSSAEKEPVYIAKQDLPAFARYVYPVIQQNMNLVHNDFNPLAYIPPKPKFEIYLDEPQENMITGELYAVYPNKKYNVLAGIEGNDRDVDSEHEADQAMSAWFNSFDPANKRLALANDDDKTYQFLKDGIPALQNLGTVYISDKLKKLQIHTMPKVSIGVSVSHDLLELDLVSEDLSLKQLSEILTKYDRKKKFYRLKNGDFVDLDQTIDELADLTDSLSLSKQDIESGSAAIPKFRAMYLDSFGNDTDMDFTRDQNFRSLIHNMSDVNERDYKLPEGLKAELRSYQKEGFRWLCALRDNGFGALLADEMGLGKTLQVIAFLGAWKDRGRSLVVCPASLVYNWSAEINKFLPSLKSRMIQGSAAMRKEQIASSEEDEVLITSYDLLKRDIKYYQNMKFSCEIIDEAQYIKNATTQASKAVKAINSTFRIALTGTPIENRLSELWSIFDYLMPGFFYSYNRFRDTFEKPIVNDKDENVQKRLTAMISPFVLRRLKKDVLKDLPDKLEEVYYAPLEGEQKDLYKARVQRLKMMLEKQSDQEFKEQKLLVLSELTRLRQLCCDPGLIYDKYTGNSAKEDLCIDMIQNAVEAGHKVLLFSQFTTMLEELGRHLEKAKIPYYLLEGSTPKKKRAEMVEQFQKDDVPVFCISLKAGGTGLNLTAADIVIHYDPWWNTAVENQASDRAHRIGQKNTVTVYRLIMKDTVEEKILALQEEKSDLAGRVLSGEGISSSRLSKEDLLSILD